MNIKIKNWILNTNISIKLKYQKRKIAIYTKLQIDFMKQQKNLQNRYVKNLDQENQKNQSKISKKTLIDPKNQLKKEEREKECDLEM